jgi:thiol:disulfide interchange protein DsbD
MRSRLLPFVSCFLLLGFLGVATAAGQFGPPVRAGVSAKASVEALVPGSEAAIAVIIDVPEGYHAQSNQPLDDLLIPTTVTLKPADGLSFGKPIYPPGKIITLPVLGEVSEYVGRVIIHVPVTVSADASAGPRAIEGTLTLQICDEQGTCFPPTDEPIALQIAVAAAGTAPVPANAELFAGYDPSAATSTANGANATTPGATIVTEDATVSLLGWSFKVDSLGVALLVGFVAGIIFNVMPCVLPVLPLKAMGFYEASHHDRAKTIAFGLVFSLGLIAVFVVLGLFVLLSKSILGTQFSWGQQFSYPWFTWSVAVVVGLLGFALLAGYALDLPTSVYGLNFRHDTYSGNFLWGGFTAILSTPCTAPLFPLVLGWAIGQPLLNGVLAVISVGVGMASPYLLLSAFPEVARRFPRTGPFAELMKQMMGFLMLSVAAFFAGMQLVKGPNHWWLVFAVAAWASLFLVVRTTQLSKTGGPLIWATLFATLITGGTLLGVLRMTDALAPRVVANGAGVAEASLWSDYSRQALAAAREQKRTVLVKFTADWCLNCKYIEQTVFKDERALRALADANVALLKADLTRSDAAGWELLRELGGTGIPFTAIYAPQQSQPLALASIYTTDTLLASLEKLHVSASAR